MVRSVSRSTPDALPMLVALVLPGCRQRHACCTRSKPAVPGGIKAATDQAADLLLDHLEKGEGAESLIAASTLADSGATATGSPSC